MPDPSKPTPEQSPPQPMTDPARRRCATRRTRPIAIRQPPAPNDPPGQPLRDPDPPPYKDPPGPVTGDAEWRPGADPLPPDNIELVRATQRA